MNVNSKGTLKLLEAYREICPKAHFYNAASSEMFGVSVDPDGYQRETTPMAPCSPYGVSKVDAYNMTAHFRRAYGLYACSGILFNHESPRRGSSFVTQKVAKGAVEIKLGLADKLVLGDLGSSRDWGHAYDYVRAMWKLVNHIEPMDLVVATGLTHSVSEMCKYVFDYLHMDYMKYVVSDPKYIRPEELSYLRGDSSKIKILLDWELKYNFQMLMEEMVDYWFKFMTRWKVGKP
jgi:GDPmannose 4,6-dehydratase